MASGFDDLDAFWDIGSLMPKKVKKPLSSFSAGPRMVEVVADVGTENPVAVKECDLSLEVGQTKNSSTYQPTDNSLITSVTVTRRENRYGFYADFRQDAAAWRGLGAEEAPFVSFFSYAPQYRQMNEAQKKYYLWWRSCAERQEYLPCDCSYFWLYVYEIINLPDVISPTQGALLLARIWAAYRQKMPKINKYMAVWLADYCLVHAVPCPHAELRPFLPTVLENASLKEFYLWGESTLSDSRILGLLALLSEYDWQSSRYAEEYSELFHEHLPHAMSPVLHELFDSGLIRYGENASVISTHSAFLGALCAGETKCTLTVCGYAFSHMSTVRATVTAAVKYAENCLRAQLSLRSRLSVPTFLPSELRRLIDAYFASHSVKKKTSPAKVPPAYEAFYDAPAGITDFAEASRIESNSWDVTKLLIPDEELLADTNAAAPQEDESAPDRASRVLSAQEKEFLSLLLQRRPTEAIAAARKAELSPETLFEHINELSLLSDIGDVVLAFDGESYAITEDYEEEIRQWISGMK
ncbi:MAG: TerB N-terminal domain-containing protein [Clostridia bacterium]|nr:TerB N-terminal domain-containing protein [Clostridia bacterium]